jgi:hypothetical protein
MAIINGEPGASKISVRVKLTANFRRQNERSSSYVRCITKPCSTPTLHSDVRCSFLKIFPFPKGNLFPGMATPLSRSGSAGHRVNRKYCISQRTDGRTGGGRAMGPPNGRHVAIRRGPVRRGRTCRRSPATNHLLRFAANSTVETGSRPVLESAAPGSPAIGEVRAPAGRQGEHVQVGSPSVVRYTVRECMG